MKILTLLAGMALLVSGCANTRPVTTKTAVAPAEAAATPNFTVIELSNATAVEMRDLLMQLLQSSERQRMQDFVVGPGSSAPQRVAPRPLPTIVADPRTNSLVIGYFDEADLQAVRDLIKRLDVKI